MKNYSPPSSPPPRSVKESSYRDVSDVEKIYISLLKESDAIDNIVKRSELPVLQVENRERIERRERESQDIYIISDNEHKSIQTYGSLTEDRRVNRVFKRKRGSYNTKAVHDRIGYFLEDLESMFGLNYKLHKTELEYWIQRLELANDRLAVNQYLKRFLMKGYFKTERGLMVFVSKTPNTPTLEEILNVQKNIATLRSVTHKPRVRRCY